MSRSSKKGAYVEPSLMKKVLSINNAPKKKNIKTWSRKSTIFPEFVGLTFDVYNVLKFNLIRLLQFSNMDIIEVTLNVSKWETFNSFTILQLKNIFDISFTLMVLNDFIFIFVNLTQL